MTDEELIAECEKNSFMRNAREVFEQFSIEDRSLSGDDRKLHQYRAVTEIAACFGLNLRVLQRHAPKPKSRDVEDLL